MRPPHGGRVCWGLAAALVVACYSESESVITAPSLFASSDDVERVRSSVVFDTLWVFGGPSDTLLAQPSDLRHDGGGGVVFEDNSSVYRVRADGDLLWSWGSPGERPGELSNVRALDVSPDGSVVLVDSGNQRVVRLSADGLLLEEVPMPGPHIVVMSVAALPGGRMAISGFDPPLALWDEDDEVAAELPSGLGESSPVQHTGHAVRWGDGGWVFGFGYGNGWMRFRGAELQGVFPYVEHVEFPVLRQVRRGDQVSVHLTGRPTDTGLTLSVVGDTLHVLFGGGVESLARGVLDRFDLPSGSYLASDVLPHYADEAVVGGDRVFTVDRWSMFPSIVALARREESGGQ